MEDGVRRRRICGACKTRWVTVERIDDVYVPAAPGRPRGLAADAKVREVADPERGKRNLARRNDARRRLEDMKEQREAGRELFDAWYGRPIDYKE